MGEFVGKRVVPDHVGVWDQKKTYEPLMIVLDGETGDSYISRKAVPVGISLADESYWSLCAHYSAQMRKLEQDVDVDVQQMHSDVTAVKNAMSQEFKETHTAISKERDDTHKAISQELSETEQRVNENLEQTSSELTGKVEQAKSDLNTGRQELKDAKDTLNKRMDSIAGGKTSDAEILDARVDADGNTHENLGAHIRSGFESARADQEEAVNHIGRMAAVSDAMRTANMVHTVDFGASNTSGDVKATAVSLGHGDRAGVIINGALKEGENDVSVLRFTEPMVTEPMAFKAGTPYTVFIDETTPRWGMASTSMRWARETVCRLAVSTAALRRQTRRLQRLCSTTAVCSVQASIRPTVNSRIMNFTCTLWRASILREISLGFLQLLMCREM